MNLDAILAGAMRDPAMRQFLQQLTAPPQRQAMRPLAPHPAFESAAQLSSRALGDFDPMSFAAPPGPIDALEQMDQPQQPGMPQQQQPGMPPQQSPMDLLALLQGNLR